MCVSTTHREQEEGGEKYLKSIPLFLYQMCSFPVLFLLLLICLVLDCVCIRFFFDFNLVNSAGEKKKEKNLQEMSNSVCLSGLILCSTFEYLNLLSPDPAKS